MLKNTFSHLPNCSVAKEQRLWASGIASWQDLLALEARHAYKKKARALSGYLQESVTHLAANNPSYFSDRLPSHQHWRFFPDFRHSIAYLDIETTGLYSGDAITTIAVYDGHSVFTYIQGENLNEFKHDIERYSLLVTYNGKCFDVPFIERYFNIQLPQAHIDLRYVLKSLGYMGGLKGCEKSLGIDRGELAGVDGFFAVLLWREYKKTKNRKALETLLAYNIEDVVNLETLLTIAYNKKLAETPFQTNLSLPMPVAPVLPFKADEETIRRLQRQAMTMSYGWR